MDNVFIPHTGSKLLASDAKGEVHRRCGCMEDVAVQSDHCCSISGSLSNLLKQCEMIPEYVMG